MKRDSCGDGGNVGVEEEVVAEILLKIVRRSRASVVLPLLEGPERPIRIVNGSIDVESCWVAFKEAFSSDPNCRSASAAMIVI